MLEPQRLKRHWPTALLFIVIAAALLYVQWITNAHRVLHEIGDFGANSLLILDAKRLHLLYGNYSRIGVNHPGPAILYVLAAGEWLFHDVLKVVPSPFSGQLLAVCFYNAAWITLVFALVRRIAGAVLPALLFTTVSLALLGFFESAVFLGIWFPDLYILPFAAMVVAISRLAYGRTDSLRALAVSSGFLINGHVSFIPMLGVTLIVMLAVNLRVARRDADKRILSAAFLRRHGREILVAAGILFLFFVPLIILTIIDFPGPIGRYIEFGGGNKHHRLLDAAKFVGLYWQPAYAWTWGVVLAALLATGVRAPSTQALRDVRGLGFACVAATAALLFYAKFGVDDLKLVYVGLFYYSVPALAAGLVAMYAYQSVSWSGKKVVAALASVAALAGAWQSAVKPVFYDELYYIPGSAELYDKLRSQPGSGRIVLDVEQDGTAWDAVWGNVVALQLYARRQGDDAFCINEHWHILFTNPAKCRPEELDTQRRYFVRPMRTAGLVDADADFEGQGLLLYRHGRVLKPVTYTKLSDRKDYFRTILGKGWSELEAEFVWSVGPVAQIDLPADPQRADKLHLDLGAFIPEKKFRQHVDVFVNGKPAGGWDFDVFTMRRQITLDLGADAAAAQHIELRIAHPVAPGSFMNTVDPRLLGVSLYGIR